MLNVKLTTLVVFIMNILSFADIDTHKVEVIFTKWNSFTRATIYKT